MKNIIPILGIAAIAVIQPQISQAQNINGVKEIAERITVKIEAQGVEGSGGNCC